LTVGFSLKARSSAWGSVSRICAEAPATPAAQKAMIKKSRFIIIR